MRGYDGSAKGDWQRPGLRQRATVFALVIMVELALLLIVIAFGGGRVRDAIVAASPISINFVPNPAARTPAPAPRRSEAKADPKPAPPVKRPPPPPTPPIPREALPYIPLSRSDLAASDIARLGSAASPAVAASGAGATAATGAGEGPGGVTLYNAEWVREPSDAELRTYLPRAVDSGSWALIACQTIAHNQVENCAQLGESPRGSGLSKAMRLAAWQFRVRPPRIDGKPMVGAWVRIRIDFGTGKED